MFDRISNTLLIKEGERRKVAYFLVLFLVIGCGMAIGRSTADALFFKRYGIEHLPLMYILLGGVLFSVTILYAVITDRIASDRFLKPLILIVSVVLLSCWISMSYFDWEPIYPIYFIVYEVVSEILLVHCTIYIAQNLDVMQAKRLTPLILGGWQAGTVIGGILLASVTNVLGVHNVLLIWVALLLVAVAMVYLHHQKSGVSAYYRAGRKGRNQLKHAYEQLQQCIVFAKHSRLLQAMSFALFFMVVTFYILCYSVNRVYTETFVSEDELAVFFGILAASTGGLGLLIQIFLTNRFIRRYGVRRMNLIFPIATMIAIGGLLFSFVLSAAIVGSLVKDALMPAFRNPTRALFFNAIPTHMQGRAHSFSIGLVLPLALSFAGLSLYLAQLIDSHIYFLVTGLLTALAYFIFNLKMNRSYLSAIISGLREKLFIPDDRLAESIKGEEQEAFDVLEMASKHEDQEIRFISAKSMLELFPARSVPVVINVLSSLTPPLRDQLIRLLLPLEPIELKEKLWEEIDKGDDHLRATILYALFQLRDNKARDLVQKTINDNNSRLKSIGIYGALHYPVPELTTEACQQWKLMLDGGDIASTLAGLDILYQWPNDDFANSLTNLLHSPDQRIKKAALNVLSVWPDNNIQGLDALIKGFLNEDDFKIRKIATICLVKFDIEKRHIIAK
jgi:AAA family ATP:ADP antiporter